jgi:hypothetical protein
LAPFGGLTGVKMYIGASLTMIDRDYGRLAHDGREHAIRLLATHNAPQLQRWTSVEGARTSEAPTDARRGNETSSKQQEIGEPTRGLEPRTPSLPWRCSTG